jgi:hypothetical protein
MYGLNLRRSQRVTAGWRHANNPLWDAGHDAGAMAEVVIAALVIVVTIAHLFG